MKKIYFITGSQNLYGDETMAQAEKDGREIAAMNYYTTQLNPGVSNMQQGLLDKHYLRKHGKNAYYGQA